jgi:hypothetical protein
VDDRTLRSAGGPGYLSYGETFPVTFDAHGRATSVRPLAGTTAVRAEDFVLPDRVSIPKGAS